MELGTGHQPERPVSLHAGPCAIDARIRRRCNRQHREHLRSPGQHAARRLRHQQSGRHALTRQQAVELGTTGIRVNCVAPGPVDTEMAKLVHSVAIRADYHDVIPLNRYGTTDEIANAVGYLCSDAASYINGQVLAVDGGSRPPASDFPRSDAAES